MKKKILVVDNEKRIVDLLYKLLSKEGFTVLTATDGETCLKLAKEAAPDLIVLDVLMPGMDGGDVARMLLEDEKTKNTPVIFLSGAISEEEVAESDGRIANRFFISKSSDSNEQIKTIKKALGLLT